MDGLDLFKKLGFGAKFDYKRFKSDAERLKIKPSYEPVRKLKDAKKLEKGGLEKVFNPTSTLGEDNIKRKADDDPELSPKKAKLEESDSNSDDSSSEKEDVQENNEKKEEENDTELQILGSIKAKTKKSSVSKMKNKAKKDTAKLAILQKEKINHIRKKNHIHAHGSDLPEPCENFQSLRKQYNLHQQIVANVREAGFNKPTPIQMQAVPVMLQRREILACAPTGSGKTAAFILPILHHLKEPRNQGFRAVVISPTRELATQTCREFKKLSEKLGFRVFLIEKAESAMKKFGPKSSKKFDILVTTPNRLIHLLNQDPPAVNLGNVEWLVVDESDKLFEEGKTGFRDQLGKIYQACDSPNIKRAMFSATFTNEVEQWCKLNLDNVVQVYIGSKNVATRTIKQELLYVGSEYGKLVAIRDIIQKGIDPPILVFVQSKERAKELFHELIYDGVNVDVIHADRTQTQRDNVVKGFRSGNIWLLICTELMGRGIDFKGVNVVINFDFPNSAISYIHRIGRTGRAGRHGKAVTFFTEEDATNLRSIANVLKKAGCPVPQYMLQLKKPKRKEVRRLARTAPKRTTIRTVPKQEIQKAKNRRKKQRQQQSKQPGAIPTDQDPSGKGEIAEKTRPSAQKCKNVKDNSSTEKTKLHVEKIQTNNQAPAQKKKKRKKKKIES